MPQRITVGVEQVRRLVQEQFPQWAKLEIEPVADGGWDNWTFHLGADKLVRLPSAPEYAQAVEKEQRWLPVITRSLPFPIPVPLAQGEPSGDYPHSWSVYQWIDGVTATMERIADPVGFAVDLAQFLVALRRIDAAGGPQPGIHNWFRGGTLRTYDKDTRRALEELGRHFDVELARDVWANALDARWDGVDRWFHGDLAGGNCLLREGRLAAVIDFGTCGVGDPACDLAISWTLMTSDGRRAFRDHLSVDAGSWARGRGWALWKTVATYSHACKDPEAEVECLDAKRVLGEIFSDYSGSGSARPPGSLPSPAQPPLSD